MGEGWGARGEVSYLRGRGKRGAARWAEVQQRGERQKKKGGWFRVGASGQDGGMVPGSTQLRALGHVSIPNVATPNMTIPKRGHPKWSQHQTGKVVM